MTEDQDDSLVTSADPVTKEARTPREPVKAAREAFGRYAAMGPPELPPGVMEQLQVELCRWQAREFGGGSVDSLTLGTNEEIGELSEAMIYLLGAQSGAARMCQAVLKRRQGIRGMDDDEAYRVALGDAIADVMVFAIQAATCVRMDAWTLLEETAREVMEKREWSKNKFDGES